MQTQFCFKTLSCLFDLVNESLLARQMQVYKLLKLKTIDLFIEPCVFRLFQVPACPTINQVFVYVFLFLNFVILLITRLGISGRKQDLVMPYLSYAITLAQVLGVLYSKKSRLGPTDLLGWVLLFDYLIYVTLPLRLRYCVLLSLVTCVSYTVAQVWLKENYLNVVQLVSVYANKN